MSRKKLTNNHKMLTSTKRQIGERIKMIRKDKGLTQKDASDLLGINFQHLSKYERGEFVPTYENLIKINELFSVDINWLLTGKGEMYLRSSPRYAEAEDRAGSPTVRDENGELQEIINALREDVELKKIIYNYVKHYKGMKEASDMLKKKRSLI